MKKKAFFLVGWVLLFLPFGNLPESLGDAFDREIILPSEEVYRFKVVTSALGRLLPVKGAKLEIRYRGNVVGTGVTDSRGLANIGLNNVPSEDLKKVFATKPGIFPKTQKIKGPQNLIEIQMNSNISLRS